jgi:glucose-6-phosphate dehydrogenase assembly protein OpcA
VSTPSLDEFTAGKSIPVAMGAIEKELSALWRHAAEQSRGAVTRACLWNLIVHTAEEDGFRRAKQLVDEVSPYLPARVLVLKTDRAAPATPMSAMIEANWHASGGGSQQIGSDEVTLAATGDGVDDLAAVVRALLVPDVPVAAVWFASSPAADNPLDRELLGAASRVVIGGESERALRGLAEVVSGERTKAEVIGSSWLRSAPWRQLLASLFDPPTPVEELFAVDRVEIDCPVGRSGAGLLLIGWLASRFRWREGRASGPGRYTFQRPRGGAAEVSLQQIEGAPEPFARVAITTGAGTYAVTRNGPSVILETPSIACKQPLHFPEERELWIAALSARGRDPLFAESLRRIASIDRMVEDHER